MMNQERLHAYVDGRLGEEEAAAARADIAADPAASDAVAAWALQNEALRSLFGPIVSEPVPPRLNVREIARDLQDRDRAGTSVRWQSLAAGLILAIGLAGGWFARDFVLPVPSTQAMGLGQEALLAHAVFTPEVRHPVEVGADESAHLGGWLSKRLAHPLAAPDLTAQGFRLVGGRLVTAQTGPAALMMYENEAGDRVTIFAARNREAETTAFHWDQDGVAGTFTWLDGTIGYAISGGLPRETMLTLAHAVYSQLSPEEKRS